MVENLFKEKVRLHVYICNLITFCFILLISAPLAHAANPHAVITYPDLKMNIAPFTLLLNGTESSSPNGDIVRWDWNFGDPTSVAPEVNEDEGMLAPHRFDNPGTYTVTLTVTDEAGNQDSTTTQIIVRAFTGQTFYVSNSEGNNNNPGTEAQPWKTFEYAKSNVGGSNSNPNKILLKRGDSWSFPDGLSAPPNTIIGAYGNESLPKPVFEFPTYNGDVWGFFWGSSNADSGFATIVEDLTIRYIPSPAHPRAYSLVGPHTPGSVLRRVDVENGGVVYFDGNKSYGLVVEDSTLDNSKKQGFFNGGHETVVRRTSITNSGSNNVLDHSIYASIGYDHYYGDLLLACNPSDCNYSTKISSITNAVLRRIDATARNGIGVGANYNQGQPPSNHIVIEDSVTHDNGGDTQSSGIYISASTNDLTIRNNKIYNNNPAPSDSGGGLAWGIAGLFLGGGGPALGHTDSVCPETGCKVRVYNNTFYSNIIPDMMISTDVYDVELRNNIFFRDETRPHQDQWDGFITINAQNHSLALSRLDSNYNHFEWVGKSINDGVFCPEDACHPTPQVSFSQWQNNFGQDQNSTFGDTQFSNTSTGDDTFLSLSESSPAVDSGIELARVFDDHTGTTRPQDGNGDSVAKTDMGAMERAEEEASGDYTLSASQTTYNQGDTIRLSVSGAQPNRLFMLESFDPANNRWVRFFAARTDANGEGEFTYFIDGAEGTLTLRSITIFRDESGDREFVESNHITITILP